MRYRANYLQQRRDDTRQSHLVQVDGKKQRDVGSRERERERALDVPACSGLARRACSPMCDSAPS